MLRSRVASPHLRPGKVFIGLLSNQSDSPGLFLQRMDNAIYRIEGLKPKSKQSQ